MSGNLREALGNKRCDVAVPAGGICELSGGGRANSLEDSLVGTRWGVAVSRLNRIRQETV